MPTLTSYQAAKVLEGHYRNPSSVLGLHAIQRDGLSLCVVRCHLPSAASVHVVRAGSRSKHPMERVHAGGLFEAVFPHCTEAFDYRFVVTGADGSTRTIEDPYNPKFKGRVTDEDAYLFGKGEHWRIHEKLGAHEVKNAGVSGVHFAVWAPCAKYVSVAGVFNSWSGKVHPMNLTKHGIWELFIPGLAAGTLYKYVIRSREGRAYVKSDPFAFSTQLRPKKSSVVVRLDEFKWTDAAWLKSRRETDPRRRPISVYELHLGSWIRKDAGENPFYNYREIAEDLVPYVKEMGFTHIELMPVMEHPLDESWGYQVTNYYAPTQRHGAPADFMHFVNTCHENGIGVIVDWVPAHFPRDPHGLGRFDGTHLFEHADPRQGFHPDWKTYIFNFGRHEVRNFLLANALFWIEKYHVDGLRVDAVASMLYLDYSRKPGQWIPNKYGGKENLEAISFLRKLNRLVAEKHPGVMTVAEESTAFRGVTRPASSGGLGFTFKWNMGWMHDTLEYFRKAPSWRRQAHGKLTFPFDYAFSETYTLVLSHDEVVHGKRSLIRKMPGEKPAKFANLRLLYGALFTHPGKKLLFMGGEFAQWKEWGVNRELDWYLLDHLEQRQVQQYLRDLNRLYVTEPLFHEEECGPTGFRWIDGSDAANSVIAFLRKGREDRKGFLCIMNASGRSLPRYRVGVPWAGYWREVFNSNAAVYGGNDEGNHPGRPSEPQPSHGQPSSLELNLPALSLHIFRFEP